MGSPTPVTTLMATLGKYPLIIFLIKLNFFLFNKLPIIQNIILFSAVSSIIVGSLYAFGQKNVKRLIAYSSMSYSGLTLVLIAIGLTAAYKMAIIYYVIYMILTLSFFNLLMGNFRGKQKKMFLTLDDFNHLFFYKPKISLYFAIVIFSYIGIPPLMGFFSKYFAIIAISKHSSFVTAVFVAIWSLLGSVYYFRFINNMFFSLEREKPHDPVFS